MSEAPKKADEKMDLSGLLVGAAICVVAILALVIAAIW